MTSSVEDAVRLGRRCGRLHALRRKPGARSRHRAMQRCAPRMRTLRDAAGRLGLPARRRRSKPRAASTRSTPSTTPRASPAKSAATSSSSTSRLEAPTTAAKLPKPYNTLQFTDVEGLRKVVKSAGRTLVLVSGGSKMGDDATDPQGARRDGSRLRRTDLRTQHVAAQVGRRALDGVAHARRSRIRPAQ